MKLLSLFSGIGGFELGLRAAGVQFEHAGFSEIDPAACTPGKRCASTLLLGSRPTFIDSADYVGAHRRRLYWTSFPLPPVLASPVPSPMLIDALLDLEDPRLAGLALSERAVAYMGRAVRGGRTHWDFNHHFDSAFPKGPCLTANLKRGVPYNVLIDRRPANTRRVLRGLHPVEAERLMGFPDDWTACLDSKGARLKAVGNSVTVPVIAALAAGLA